MRYEGLLLAVLMVSAMVAPAAAQGLTGERIEKSLNPLVALIQGVTRIGWTLTKLFVGMDEASMAYFAYELGFRRDEVYVDDLDVYTDLTMTSTTTKDCSVGSFAEYDIGGPYDGVIHARCTDNANEEEVDPKDMVWTDYNTTLNMNNINDANEDGRKDLADVFHYISYGLSKNVEVSNSAKGQIMLFALLIPLGMLTFMLYDFFLSTGILHRGTSTIISLGIALIAARSGVYTALLRMISDIFGAGGFFLSMLSIYLILAILFWFYGGILRSKAIAEKEEMVANAVVAGFAADLSRGLLQKQTAKKMAEEEKK